MMSPGKTRAPVNTRCGAPTATATSSRISSPQVAGNSAALESLETTFHQDLNGDGTIGVPATPVSHVAARSISAMMRGAGNDNFVFHADTGAAPAVTVADKFEPHEFSSTGDTNITALLNEAHDHWRSVQSAGGPDLAGDHHDAEAARSPFHRPASKPFHHSLTRLLPSGMATASGLVTTVIESFGSTSQVEVERLLSRWEKKPPRRRT